VIAAAPVDRLLLERELRQDLVRAADVVVVVVRRDVVVDLGDPQLLDVEEGLVAEVPHPIVEQDGFALRADEDRPVTLAYVHEVNLELAIRLGKGRENCREVQQGQRRRARSQATCTLRTIYVMPTAGSN
jgi:hypothetical protein